MSNGVSSPGVRDEVDQLAVSIGSYRLLERERGLGHPQKMLYLIDRHAQLGGNLAMRRFATQIAGEIPAGAFYPVEPLGDMNRETDHP